LKKWEINAANFREVVITEEKDKKDEINADGEVIFTIRGDIDENERFKIQDEVDINIFINREGMRDKNEVAIFSENEEMIKGVRKMENTIKNFNTTFIKTIIIISIIKIINRGGGRGGERGNDIIIIIDNNIENGIIIKEFN
jgi:hypothetical protein